MTSTSSARSTVRQWGPAPAPIRHRRTMRPPAPAGPPAPAATVTVVIPCYNYARYLPEAVASVLSQDGVAVDVVIVDDCSTDDSAEVAASLAAADPRIRLLRNADNRGPVETFNAGLAEATGEFLVRLDADDLLTPGSLARAVGLARAFPSVGLVYGHPVHFIDGQERMPARMHATRWTVWPGSRWVMDRCADGFNVITSAEVCMRMSVVRRVGGQRPLAHTHDMEMWMRLASVADVGYVHGVDQAWHREHSASLSARKVDIVVDLQERRQAFDTLFAGPAGELPWAEQAERAARRALDRHTLELLEHEVDVDGGRSAAFRSLVALDVEPVPENVRHRDRILRRAGRTRGPVDRGLSMARRARGMVRSRIRQRRWRRRGEY